VRPVAGPQVQRQPRKQRRQPHQQVRKRAALEHSTDRRGRQRHGRAQNQALVVIRPAAQQQRREEESAERNYVGEVVQHHHRGTSDWHVAGLHMHDGHGDADENPLHQHQPADEHGGTQVHEPVPVHAAAQQGPKIAWPESPNDDGDHPENHGHIGAAGASGGSRCSNRGFPHGGATVRSTACDKNRRISCP
jgi:hypothetical protein